MNARKTQAVMAVACLVIVGITCPAWSQPFGTEIKLTASDAAGGGFFGNFGFSVGISGGTAMVGAPRNDDACP